MTTISKNDREGISNLHAAASGAGPSRNYRDASRSSSQGPWKQIPTQIKIPSNHPEPRQSLGNPYSGSRLKSNLNSGPRGTVHKTPRAGYGNVNAGRAPIPMVEQLISTESRPTKRPKLETTQGIRSRHFETPKSTLQPRPRRSTSITEISSDDERPPDRRASGNHQSHSSRDELDIMRDPSPEIPPLPDYTFNSDEVQETPDLFGPQERTTAVKDGPNTKHVFSALGHTQEQGSTGRQRSARPPLEDAAEPVYSSTDTGPSRQATPPGTTQGRVKAMAKRIDARGQPARALKTVPPVTGQAVPTRHLDGSIKNSMKPKGVPAVRQKLEFTFVKKPSDSLNVQPTPHDFIATAPSNFVSSQRREPPVADSVVIDLPLCAWCIGLELQREDAGIQSRIVWHRSANKFSLIHGTDTDSPLKVLSVALSRSAFEMVKWADLKSLRSHPLIQLTVSDPTSCHGPFSPSLLTSRRTRDITLMFDPKNQNWDRTVYIEFVDHLVRCATQREVLAHQTPDRVWEMAVNMAELSQLQQYKEHHEDIVAGSSGRRSSIDSSERGSKPKGKPKAPSTQFGLLRRSTRHSAPEDLSPIIVPDGDEVVLVYPPNGRGAVNITNGDIARLRPGEFLNDTLIEFGLKLSLDQLRETDPGLADQVHVFSSFFYKKFATKNLEEGYKSVRKWTSKLDIFQKKFIIVPINEHLHWYLAIIYQPEHTLSPPPPDKVEGPSRKSMRLQGVQAESLADPPSQLAFTTPAQAAFRRQRSVSIVPESPQADGQSTDVDRGEESAVEDMIANFSEHSVSQPGKVEDMALSGAATQASSEPENEVQVAEAVDIDMEDGELQYPSSDPAEPPNGDHDADGDIQMTNGDASQRIDSNAEAGPSGGSTVESVSSSTTKPPSTSSAKPPSNSSRKTPPTLSGGPTTNSGAVSVANFYGISTGKLSEKAKGKQRAVPPADFEAPLTAEDEPRVHNISDDDAEPAASAIRPIPYIFTFDSLGSNHPAVGKKLATYLQMEALDKKGLEKDRITPAEAKQAHVPGQPNYCDCGIYLLHFVNMFMKDPEESVKIILATSGKRKRAADPHWDPETATNARRNLEIRVQDMSTKWKEDHAQKEEEKKHEEEPKKQEGSAEGSSGEKEKDSNVKEKDTPAVSTVEDSDSDIELVRGPPTPKKPRGGRKPPRPYTSSSRQKAARMRG